MFGFARQMRYAEGRYDYPVVLMDDFYKDYHFFILNLGTHPTAYVVLPEGHEFFGKDWDEIPVSCHYGLTYSEDCLYGVYGHPKYLKNKNVWIIGWDYNHAGDFHGTPFPRRVEKLHDKQWTTEEIYNEVKDVINQLIELNKP